MDRPRMLFQRCPELKGYVALMAQFLPTFEQRKESVNQDQDGGEGELEGEGAPEKEIKYYEGDLGGIP